VVLILALFACVVMHEFGHALTARRFGIRTRSITLLPIGGVAAMEKMPEDPKQEFLVALAGPMVNVVIALLLFIWFLVNPAEADTLDSLDSGTALLYQLLVINIILVIFNLLPAFPMDGGRVLRAALAMRMDHLKATQIASKIGQAMAVMMFVLGLLYNPLLMFIALFIWFGANAEASMEEMNTSIHDARAIDAMITQFNHLSSHQTLKDAMELTLHGTQRDFPVVGNTHPVLLTQNSLVEALKTYGEGKMLGELELPALRVVPHDMPLKKVMEQFQSEDVSAIGVTRGGHVIGMINLENIVELISFQSALHQPGSREM
jgi:Zn-dependent protease